MALTANPPYPVQLDVEYPAQLSRLTTFFRGITMIPSYLLMLVLGIGAFFVYIFAWFGILFTGRYPEGMFNYMAGVMNAGSRFGAYMFLLTDRFPPLGTGDDPAYPVQFSIEPPVKIARWRCFVQGLMAYPALIAAAFVGFLGYICVIFAWFAILFTGRYPEGLFNTAAVALRWNFRVNAYAYLMTEQYPPFVWA